MGFRQWLLNEDLGADHGSNWFYGNQLLPSDGYDGGQSFEEPSEMKFLQTRWMLEKQYGRKFYNIDPKEFEQRKFSSVYSKSMPKASGGGWKHKSDGPNLEIDNNASLKLQGHRKRADIANVLWKINPMIDNTKELNKIFGEFEPKYQELSKDFDKPWTNKKTNKRK